MLCGIFIDGIPVFLNFLDYGHAQKVLKEFNLQNLGDYHDLYVQSDTLLLADIFENFRNKCIELYELDLLIFYQHQD